MKKEANLTLAILFFAILAIEVICYNSIITHPYMVSLCVFLGCIGGFHLGLFISKLKN